MDGESLRVDKKVELVLLPIVLLIVLSRLLISSLLFLCFCFCVFVLPTVLDYAIGFCPSRLLAFCALLILLLIVMLMLFVMTSRDGQAPTYMSMLPL